ncbi:MAG: rhomboid family intramembrane serine protease, partial [Deltaproteobacteria bacterium]|nr:rhomboid family intramembrane serine protease [Deltaproteobacteria bacterium]
YAPGRRPLQVRSEALFGVWPAETLPVAKALLTVTMVVFGLQLMSAWRAEPSLSTLLDGGGVLDALRSGAMLSVPNLVAMEPWRLLSACFVHFGVLHLGMNMLGLLHLCRLLEPAIGSVRLLVLYVVTGILGFAVSLAYYTMTARHSPTAGASGAVFGLMGAVLGFMYRRKDERWKNWAVQTVGYSLLFGLVMPGINNAAHIAGLVSGAAMGWLMALDAPRPSSWWQRILAALAALAIVGSLVLARLSDLPEVLAALGGRGS